MTSISVDFVVVEEYLYSRWDVHIVVPALTSKYPPKSVNTCMCCMWSSKSCKDSCNPNTTPASSIKAFNLLCAICTILSCCGSYHYISCLPTSPSAWWIEKRWHVLTWFKAKLVVYLFISNFLMIMKLCVCKCAVCSQENADILRIKNIKHFILLKVH